MFPPDDGERSWIKERLVIMDPVSFSYVYRLEASNMGLDGSVNSLQLVDQGEGNNSRSSVPYKEHKKKPSSIAWPFFTSPALTELRGPSIVPARKSKSHEDKSQK